MAIFAMLSFYGQLTLADSVSANHGTRTLDVTVTNATSSGDVNSGGVDYFILPSGNTETITATLSSAPADDATVHIDFEVTADTLASDVDPDGTDGDSRLSPDDECTITGPADSCSVSFTGGAAAAGESLNAVAWIDHDNDNSTDESDAGEGVDETVTASASCSAGTDGDGDVAEDDNTDCVQINWEDRVVDNIDCDDETPGLDGDGDDPSTEDFETNPAETGSSETYTCEAIDQFGDPLDGVDIDGENQSSVNDPNDDGDTPGSPDYTGCTTGTSGTCDTGTQVIFDDQSESGTADICWFVAGSTGNCGEAVGATENDDDADVVQKTWEDRVPDRLDAEPEADANAVGDDHTITARVFDQFGDAVGSGETVNFEILSGPSDIDGATPDTPDASDTTDGSGDATFTYSQALSEGTDFVCAYLPGGAADANSSQPDECDGETSADTDPTGFEDPGSGDDQDVVEKEWAAPGEPASIECVGGCDASNPRGDGNTHDFTIRVEDENGVAVADGTEVSAEVESGPDQDDAGNGTTRDDSCTTVSGECDITISNNGDSGTDEVRFWIDENGNEQFDSGELNTTSTKTWHGDPFDLTIEPTSDSAAVSSCNGFTVTAVDDSGVAVPGEVINIIRDHADADITDGDLDFCDPGSDFPNNGSATEIAVTEGDDEGETDNSTDENGQVSFGIHSDVEGDETITVYWDGDGNDDRGTGEPAATADKTWTPGGASGAETVDAEPETDTNPAGSDHDIDATVTNSAGDPIPDVDVDMQVDSGPNAGATDTCTTTDPDGSCTLTYTSNGDPGTDSITVWVNTGDSRDTTPGPDPDEPQDQVEKTWEDPPDDVKIDVTCEGQGSADTGDNLDEGNPDDDSGEGFADNDDVDCRNPAETGFEDVEFRALVTTDDAEENPVEGALVEWTREGDFPDTGDDSTFVADECVTDADGMCDVTVNNPTPDDGDGFTAEGTVVAATSTDGDEVDRAGKQWQDREPFHIEIDPQRDTNEVGGTHSVTVTLIDQFGDPVQGEEIDIEVTGRNPSGTSFFDQTTDASGQVSAQWTDGGDADGGPPHDDIDAWRDTNGNDADDDGETNDALGVEHDPENIATGHDAEKQWVEDVTAEQVALDMFPGGDGGSDTTPDPDDDTVPPEENTADCDADLTDLSDNDDLGGDDWDKQHTGDVGTVELVCVSAKNANGDTLFGQDVTLDSTGVGVITDADGPPPSVSSDTATIDADGYAEFYIFSQDAGDQDVTATLDAATDQGTKTWEERPARIVDAEPETATNQPGTDHTVTATVTDANGNPIDGQNVVFTLSGDGTFSDGTCCSKEVTTNASGEAKVNITHNAEGTSTVNASIDDADTTPSQPNECDEPADSPQTGDPEGVCEDEVTKTWSEEAPAPTPCENPTIEGTAGDDTITGTTGDDVIDAKGGNDFVDGLEGDDTICLGPGDDTGRGRQGADTIFGEGGIDTIRSDNGFDTVNGGDGADDINGGAQGDTINGGPGDDFIAGSPGEDDVNGGDGNDNINLARGIDSANGGPGVDLIHGSIGDDDVSGGGGDDDTIAGDADNDNVSGGPGNDSSLHGGGGNDSVAGNSGNDDLFGEPGDDFLHGGPGTDFGQAGAGFDTCVSIETEVDCEN